MARQPITRERIIEATVRVIHTNGVAGATTRAIVRAVPCAEGTLYLYFKHRTELILAVIEQSVGAFVEVLKRLPHHVGRKTVAGNLATIIQQAAKFQEEALTLLCGVVSDPELLRSQQIVMRQARKGPHLSRLAIANYLEAEKAEGRVSPRLDSKMVAGLLLRASFGCIFEKRFAGASSGTTDRRQMKTLIVALLANPSGLVFRPSRGKTTKSLKRARKARA